MTNNKDGFVNDKQVIGCFEGRGLVFALLRVIRYK